MDQIRNAPDVDTIVHKRDSVYPFSCAYHSELGTNDLRKESALELLKAVL